tara:strand:- start:2547 stop:3101 length:555 start_codon:yes stop_codon:yes gene_type:complete
MLQLNGKTLRIGKAFVTEDGRQFPANWLSLASLEEKQSIGIVEVPDQPQAVWDTRFYWGVDNPKDLDDLKALWTAKVKEAAGSLLSQTDWYVVRQAENSAAVPAEVLSRRGEIRAFSNVKEAAIAACGDVAELAEYVTGSDYFRWEPLPPEPEPEPTPEPTPEPEATPEPTPTTETPAETTEEQ